MAPTHPDPSDADLFEPVLTAEHEVQGVELPFRPNSLVLLTFFAGPLCGGLVMAANFRRLGQPGRFGRWSLLFATTWLATFLFSALVLSDPASKLQELRDGSTTHQPAESGSTPPARQADRRTSEPADSRGVAETDAGEQRSRDRAVRFLVRLVGLVPAFFAAGAQRRRFENFERAGGEPASLWLVGSVAFLISLGLHTLAAFALAAALVFLY